MRTPIRFLMIAVVALAAPTLSVDGQSERDSGRSSGRESARSSARDGDRDSARSPDADTDRSSGRDARGMRDRRTRDRETNEELRRGRPGRGERNVESPAPTTAQPSPVSPPLAAPPATLPPAAARPVPAVRGPAAPQPHPPQPSRLQPTRIQLEVFEVAASPEHFVQFDLDTVTSGTPGAEELLARLKAYGTPRLLGRFDEMVSLPGESKLTMGANMPTVQSVSVSSQGHVTPSVSYQSVGTTVTISGNWRNEGRSLWADLNTNIELSTISKSSVKVSSDVQIPIFNKFSSRKTITLHHGRPVYLLASYPPEAGDETITFTVNLIRLKAVRAEAEEPTDAAIEITPPK
ncbi:MAG: hypothetical protein AMXMBFR13_40160 [Phycisphaerae bacterium]